jgi:hypothetical protein
MCLGIRLVIVLKSYRSTFLGMSLHYVKRNSKCTRIYEMDWTLVIVSFQGHEFYNPMKKNYIFLRSCYDELKPRSSS